MTTTVSTQATEQTTTARSSLAVVIIPVAGDKNPPVFDQTFYTSIPVDNIEAVGDDIYKKYLYLNTSCQDTSLVTITARDGDVSINAEVDLSVENHSECKNNIKGRLPFKSCVFIQAPGVTSSWRTMPGMLCPGCWC